MIQYRLAELLEEYRTKTGHKLAPSRVADDIGVSKNVIIRMAENQARRVDLDIMELLIPYLRQRLKRKITLDDLLPFSE